MRPVENVTTRSCRKSPIASSERRVWRARTSQGMLEGGSNVRTIEESLDIVYVLAVPRRVVCDRARQASQAQPRGDDGEPAAERAAPRRRLGSDGSGGD